MTRPSADRPFLVRNNPVKSQPGSGHLVDLVLDYFRTRRAEIDHLIDFLSAQLDTENKPKHARSSNSRRGA